MLMSRLSGISIRVAMIHFFVFNLRRLTVSSQICSRVAFHTHSRAVALDHKRSALLMSSIMLRMLVHSSMRILKSHIKLRALIHPESELLFSLLR